MNTRAFASVLIVLSVLGAVPATVQAESVQVATKLKKDAKNVNTASFDDLSATQHMSPALARAIVDGRPWKTPEDLVNRKDLFDLGDVKKLKKAFKEGYLFVK